MPFSSAEISASIGAFQGQAMNNMAYSQMIGMGPFNQGAISDRLAGGSMSRAAGIGGPLAMGGLGLMGLDPMSLGLRAGMSAWGGGAGLMGAGVAGFGAMGMAAGGLGAVGFVGNQMLTGAQQQAHLNNNLRSNFNFINSAGTQGFGRTDMAQIGGMLRSSTHQVGPEGQIAGFGELTNLVQNMGKMGMTTAVRDVQEFGRKFREMLQATKTIARELGTSLEEAQQFMAAQRNSGIFKAADQAKFATQARGTSFAGGLALSEVTGMANVGAQISRSVGGLGRAGAFGGMRAIGQVGSALQTGAISEEDIYNSTGLTGADGRQALASNMMASGANFLRSGRGRWFLASMAGRNGQLDEESVSNWMSGGMDVGETKGQAYKNLGRVGRANFIRNEGRLRGSVLERFGAMAPTMAYQQWLSSRGYDPNNMDDKSMLAFQRFSGMGRDEADTAVSMVQKLPELMKQQRVSAADDTYASQLSSKRQTSGIEGMKRRFEQIREGIQGKMQQAGADVFTSASDMIEQWWNRVTGIYERRVTEGIDDLMESAKMGGRGSADFSLALGGGRGMVGQSLGQQGIADSMSRMGGMGGADGAGAAAMRRSYEISRQGLSSARMGALSAGTKETSDFIGKNRDWFREAYTTSLSGFEGERRVSEFGNQLKLRANGGDPQAQAMYEQWKSAGKNGRAALLGTLEKQAGVSEKVRLGNTWELPSLGLSGGQFATEREGNVAVGRQMLGEYAFITGKQHGFSFRNVIGTLGAGAGVLAGLAAEPIAGALGYDPGELAGLLGTKGGSVLSGGEELAASMGAYAKSKEGSRLMSGLMTGQKGASDLAQDRMMELQHQIGRSAHGLQDLSTSEQGEFLALTQTSLGAEYGKLMDEGAPTAKLRALEEKAQKMLGHPVSENELKRFFRNGAAAVGVQAQANVERVTERTLDAMSRRREAMLTVGVGRLENIRMGGGARSKEGLVLDREARQKLGEKGSQVVQLAMASMAAGDELSGLAEGDPRKREILSQIYGDQQTKGYEGQIFESIAGMSISEKKQLARGAAGTDVGSMAGESIMRERRLQSMMKSRGAGGRRQGVVGAFGSMLGLELSAEELEGFQGKGAGDIAKFLASKGGFKDDAFKGELQKAIEAAKSGKTGTAADLLARGISQSDEVKKKLGERQKDPMQEMTDAVKQSNKYLEALVKSNDGAKALLSQISNNTSESSDNAENKGNK